MQHSETQSSCTKLRYSTLTCGERILSCFNTLLFFNVFNVFIFSSTFFYVYEVNNISERCSSNVVVTWHETYRVTRIIVNDFESENLYVANFINRQTLYRSIGRSIKLFEENIKHRKYYT